MVGVDAVQLWIALEWFNLITTKRKGIAFKMVHWGFAMVSTEMLMVWKRKMKLRIVLKMKLRMVLVRVDEGKGDEMRKIKGDKNIRYVEN